MGLRSKSKTRLIILTAACASVAVLGGSFYIIRKMEHARSIAACKPLGIAAYNKGEWVESLNILQSYLSVHDDDLEVQEYFVKVQAKLPEPGLAHLRKEMGAYRRIVALKPGDMDAKRELLKLYLALQMNTELLNGTDEIIKAVAAQFTTVEAVPTGAAVSTGTAPADGLSAAARAYMDAVNKAIAAIKEKAKDSDAGKREELNTKYIEPLVEALELRTLSTTNLRRLPEALAAANALVLLKGDAAAFSVKLNAMRANGDSKTDVLKEMERLTGWKKGDSLAKLTDEPMVALMAGNYLFYVEKDTAALLVKDEKDTAALLVKDEKDTAALLVKDEKDTAALLVNKAVTMEPPTEIAAMNLADLLDRMEQPEMFVKARDVIEQARQRFKNDPSDKTEPLEDEHYRRLVFQKQYQQADLELGKLDVTKRPLPLAMRVIALCEESKDMAAAGDKAGADKKKEEARGVLDALDLCGKRWDTLAIGWHDVLKLVYFSDAPQDRQVVDACEIAITRDPMNPFYFAFQGDAYRATGDTAAALQKWRSAAQRAPAWDQPLARAARFYVNSGAPEQTLQLAPLAY